MYSVNVELLEQILATFTANGFDINARTNSRKTVAKMTFHDGGDGTLRAHISASGDSFTVLFSGLGVSKSAFHISTTMGIC